MTIKTNPKKVPVVADEALIAAASFSKGQADSVIKNEVPKHPKQSLDHPGTRTPCWSQQRKYLSTNHWTVGSSALRLAAIVISGVFIINSVVYLNNKLVGARL